MSNTKILVVDDEKDYQDTFKMLLEHKGFIVDTAKSADEALEKMRNEYFPLVLSDVMMPGTNGIEFLIAAKQEILKPFELILVTGYGNVQTAISAIKNGAFGFFIKSHNPEELIIEIEKARRSIQMKNKILSYEKETSSDSYLSSSKNLKMSKILELCKVVAPSDSNILITGESGVGKEVIAKLIHENSNRANMPFITINCQTFSDNMIESELFGHEKGSFTGAINKRIGRFEEANGGTIFLDEIGELSSSTQVKLLRVLENRSIERIGSNKNIMVNFRLICATNKDITPKENSSFREDLFYRINTIELNIPPLRERKEDLDDLIFFFLTRFNKSTKKNINSISPQTMEYLKSCNYPGNIRELKNIVERLVVTAKDNVLNIENSGIFDYNISNNEISQESISLDALILEDGNLAKYNQAKINFEKYYFTKAFATFDGNITKAAEYIGLSRRQLFNKIVEFDIKK